MNESTGNQLTRLQSEIASAILNYIRASRLGKGDRLPSQEEFADQLKISRATLREALARLTSEGIIRQVHGIGTFVAEDLSVVHSSAALDFSITEMIRIQGMEPNTSEVKISIERIPFEAEPTPNEELETEVMCLRRVRTADGVPFAYTVAYLPLSLRGLVLDEQAYVGSLYIYLQEKCGEFVSEAETVIEAQVAVGEVSQKLGVPPQTPILALHQLHYNPTGKLLVKSDDYFVQNRLQLKIKRSRPGII
ncbi:MAG: GntR family transcriptional regulator [Anaerolineaceae bacterium]|nr:GntR family transcriptional regulator [Anaerolineaceae bacterium]